jgi:hypothetical protein
MTSFMESGNGITPARTIVIYARKYAGRSRCMTEQNRTLSPVQGRKHDLRMRKGRNEPQTALDARGTKDLREIFDLALLFQLRSGADTEDGARESQFRCNA